jgi:steroid delta-isomerase-like uncharacterized protein
MKSKLVVPIVALFLAACQSQPATETAQTSEADAAAAAAAEAKALVNRYYEAFNSHDREVYSELFTADAETWSTDGSTVSGVEAVADWDMAWYSAFPDARITSERMITEGSFIVSENHFTGRHEATMVQPDGQEIPATGNQVDVPYVAVFEIEGGKLKRQRIYYNSLTVVEQLGLEP